MHKNINATKRDKVRNIDVTKYDLVHQISKNILCFVRCFCIKLPRKICKCYINSVGKMCKVWRYSLEKCKTIIKYYIKNVEYISNIHYVNQDKGM